MDPTAAYLEMTAAWRAGNYGTAWEIADDLTMWLRGGGFEPDIPNMTSADVRYYITRIHDEYLAYANHEPDSDDVRATIDPPTTNDPNACAANGMTSDGRRYHYDAAHNGYVFDN